MDEQRETPDPADRAAQDSPLEAVVDRLADRFPTIERPHIADIVETEAANLEDGARVTDFIPVLVEHEVKEQLRTEADPLPVAVPEDADTAG